MSDELPAVYVNYNRHEMEIDNLRRRVTELEHSNFDLQRKYYELLTYVKGKEIEEYLANYKPKRKQK